MADDDDKLDNSALGLLKRFGKGMLGVGTLALEATVAGLKVGGHLVKGIGGTAKGIFDLVTAGAKTGEKAVGAAGEIAEAAGKGGAKVVKETLETVSETARLSKNAAGTFANLADRARDASALPQNPEGTDAENKGKPIIPNETNKPKGKLFEVAKISESEKEKLSAASEPAKEGSSTKPR